MCASLRAYLQQLTPVLSRCCCDLFRDIHAAATRVEDMLASFDGDAFSAVELHDSNLEQAAQMTPLIPTRSSRRMTLRGGVSTPTVAASVSTAAVIGAAETAADSQEAPATPPSAAAAGGGGQEAGATSDLWSVVSQHTNQLSAKLKATSRQKQGGDSWQQPGGMVSAMDTNERAEQQPNRSQVTTAGTAGGKIEGSSSAVAAATASGGGGGVDLAAGTDEGSARPIQGDGRRALRRALAKVYERVL
jgi:hypothetical protein